MKKLAFALTLSLLLVFAIATVAMADNGPHGGFTSTTDACAGCHRAHSAKVGSNSLLILNAKSLCLTCHDGTGAATNVVDGVYRQAGSPYNSTEGTNGASLFGGGFTNALMATTWSGATTAPATSRAVSSSHTIGVGGTTWGSGLNNSGNGGMVLECTSCHDPHGNSGYSGGVKVSSYRLLRWQPQGSNGFEAPTNVNWSGGAFPTNGTTTGWLVPDNFTGNGNEWYTIGATGAAAAGDYMAGDTNNVYNTKNPAATGVGGVTSYIPAAVNTAFFCAQCHDRYFNNAQLNNAGDASAYCGGVAAPTSIASVHPTHPATECLPYFSAGGWIWADIRSSGDNIYSFRHASGDIRSSMDGATPAGLGTTVSHSCVACHVSHGTTATMSVLAGTADSAAALAAGNRDGASLAGGSTLLRLDNRSVCIRCHFADVNFVVP
jgi:predicted CXXCH cytochrome family protein